MFLFFKNIAPSITLYKCVYVCKDNVSEMLYIEFSFSDHFTLECV